MDIYEEVLKLSHNEDNPDMFWKLVSFPIHPQFYEYTEKVQRELETAAHELAQELEWETPRYPDESLDSDESLDVVQLLSSFGGGHLVRNNGDRVALNADTFKGKYVLICCFHVPVVRGLDEVHKVVNLCNELYSTRDDFEMVMVAKMNDNANHRDVFDHFFSGLPESCLAVPFEDSESSDYICKVLNLGIYRNHQCQCVVLDAQGKRLPLKANSEKMEYYGAEAFPFTKDIMYESAVECRELIFGSASLERILRCNDSSPDFVYKINSREEVPISKLTSEFKNKHVGLYLCSEGKLLSHLLDMHDTCREKQIEFEVIVVYQPFAEPIDPKIFQEKIDDLLQKHNVRGWWCLPFNNSVSRRFWRFAEHYDTEDGEGWLLADNRDKLMVVGPDVDHLDVYGDCVMSSHGIDAFPFTIDAAIKARIKKLQEITLESLFVDDDDVLFFRGNDRNDVISAKELKGKKVSLLYIDKLQPWTTKSVVETLTSVHNDMKAAEEDGDFEMIFIEDPMVGFEDEEVDKMPWYVCPKDGNYSLTNMEELMMAINRSMVVDCNLDKWPDVLVGFGEDGRVCSVGMREIPLSDTLYKDVEEMLLYHKFTNHRMQRFAYPERGQY